MRVSIKDIAQAAGVSHSTVSRALTDSPLVKAETKARVLEKRQILGIQDIGSAQGPEGIHRQRAAAQSFERLAPPVAL